MTWTEARSIGKFGNAEILGRIRCYPALGFLQRRSANRRGFAFATELHLSPRSFEEHHQLRCHFPSDLATKILLNERQRKIQSSRHACRRSKPSIADMNGVRLYRYLGIRLRQAIGDCPVGCYSASV